MNKAFTLEFCVVAVEIPELLLDTNVLTLLSTGADEGGVQLEIYVHYLVRNWELLLWDHVLFSFFRAEV